MHLNNKQPVYKPLLCSWFKNLSVLWYYRIKNCWWQTYDRANIYGLFSATRAATRADRFLRVPGVGPPLVEHSAEHIWHRRRVADLDQVNWRIRHPCLRQRWTLSFNSVDPLHRFGAFLRSDHIGVLYRMADNQLYKQEARLTQRDRATLRLCK